MEQSSAKAVGCCGASISPEFRTRVHEVVRNRIVAPPPVVCFSFTGEPLSVNYYGCFGSWKTIHRPRSNVHVSTHSNQFHGRALRVARTYFPRRTDSLYYFYE